MPDIRSAGTTRLVPPANDSTAQSLSWDEAFAQCYAEICGYTLRFVGSVEVAEDLVEDLFLSLWTKRPHDLSPPLTRAYLFVAAKNRALLYLRHQRVAERWIERVEREPMPLSPAPSDLYLDHELEEAVEKAIAELPDRCRRIFLLRRRDGLSYEEIARQIGVSLPTVKSHLYRATLSLRAKLKPYLTAT